MLLLGLRSPPSLSLLYFFFQIYFYNAHCNLTMPKNKKLISSRSRFCIYVYIYYKKFVCLLLRQVIRVFFLFYKIIICSIFVSLLPETETNFPILSGYIRVLLLSSRCFQFEWNFIDVRKLRLIPSFFFSDYVRVLIALFLLLDDLSEF